MGGRDGRRFIGFRPAKDGLGEDQVPASDQAPAIALRPRAAREILRSRRPALFEASQKGIWHEKVLPVRLQEPSHCSIQHAKE